MAPSRGVTPERAPPSLHPPSLRGCSRPFPAGCARSPLTCQGGQQGEQRPRPHARLGSARFGWAGLRSAAPARFKWGVGAEETGGGPGELRHCEPMAVPPPASAPAPAAPSPPLPSGARQLSHKPSSSSFPRQLPQAPFRDPCASPRASGKGEGAASLPLSAAQRMRYHPFPPFPPSEDA